MDIQSVSKKFHRLIPSCITTLICPSYFKAERLRELTNLKSLYLWYNPIVENVHLSNLTQLTALNLKANRKINSEALLKLTNLTSLNLSNNTQIKGFVLQSLPSLTDLNLNQNEQISSEELQTLTQLQSLSLLENKVINATIFKSLTNLKRLNLSDNKMIHQSDLLPLCHSLVKLCINRSQMYVPCGDLFQWKKWEKLIECNMRDDMYSYQWEQYRASQMSSWQRREYYDRIGRLCTY